MKKETICRETVSSKRKVSIFIDKSTKLSRKTALVVVIRALYGDIPGERYVLNLDLIELSGTSAENILRFEKNFLQECYTGFYMDGASVMLGEKSGVAARLVSHFPQIIL